MAMCHLRGHLGVEIDIEKGRAMLRQASNNSDPDSSQASYMFGLIQLGELPSVAPPDPNLPFSAGIQAIERAAWVGFGPALLRMGLAWQGGEKGYDSSIALRYFHIVSRQQQYLRWKGDRSAGLGGSAEVEISKWLLCGSVDRFPANEEYSFYFAKLATEQENGLAEFAVGYFYEVGIFVEQDIKTALIWYGIAASHENKDAAERLKELSLNRSNTISKQQHKRALTIKGRGSIKSSIKKKLDGKKRKSEGHEYQKPSQERIYPDTASPDPTARSNSPSKRVISKIFPRKSDSFDNSEPLVVDDHITDDQYYRQKIQQQQQQQQQFRQQLYDEQNRPQLPPPQQKLRRARHSLPPNAWSDTRGPAASSVEGEFGLSQQGYNQNELPQRSASPYINGIPTIPIPEDSLNLSVHSVSSLSSLHTGNMRRLPTNGENRRKSSPTTFNSTGNINENSNSNSNSASGYENNSNSQSSTRSGVSSFNNNTSSTPSTPRHNINENSNFETPRKTTTFPITSTHHYHQATSTSGPSTPNNTSKNLSRNGTPENERVNLISESSYGGQEHHYPHQHPKRKPTTSSGSSTPNVPKSDSLNDVANIMAGIDLNEDVSKAMADKLIATNPSKESEKKDQNNVTDAKDKGVKNSKASGVKADANGKSGKDNKGKDTKEEKDEKKTWSFGNFFGLSSPPKPPQSTIKQSASPKPPNVKNDPKKGKSKEEAVSENKDKNGSKNGPKNDANNDAKKEGEGSDNQSNPEPGTLASAEKKVESPPVGNKENKEFEKEPLNRALSSPILGPSFDEGIPNYKNRSRENLSEPFLRPGSSASGRYRAPSSHNTFPSLDAHASNNIFDSVNLPPPRAPAFGYESQPNHRGSPSPTRNITHNSMISRRTVSSGAESEMSSMSRSSHNSHTSESYRSVSNYSPSHTPLSSAAGSGSSSPQKQNMSHHPRNPNVLVIQALPSQGKGPKTFEEMAVPVAKPKEDCIIM